MGALVKAASEMTAVLLVQKRATFDSASALESV